MFILFHIQCSIVNKYKGKDMLRRIPHASDGWKLNPFAILNKQGHRDYRYVNGNIPVALRCVTFFSYTSEPNSVLFSYKKLLII